MDNKKKIKKIKNIDDVIRKFSKHVGDVNENDINTPINISLIAPSRSGKTSLISTIYYTAEDCINKRSGVNIILKDDSDKKRLDQFREQIRNIFSDHRFPDLKVGGALAGTSERKVFRFAITFQNKEISNLVLQQNYEIQDIPGGWVSEGKEGEFVDFLHDTRILVIPIDAPLLMEPFTDEEKQKATSFLDDHRVHELVRRHWLQFFSEYGQTEIALFLVPVKCEAYMDDPQKQDDLKKRVIQKYAKEPIKFKNTHENLNLKVYYVPVETIGGIRFKYGMWGADSFEQHFSFRNNFGSADSPAAGSENNTASGACFAQKNAELLISKIFEYSHNEINLRIQKLRNKKDNTRWFGKLSASYRDSKRALECYEEYLQPIIDSFEKTYKKHPLGKYEIRNEDLI